MNSIIEGDVLEVLRSLPAEPSFDCVIADPPYNHGIWMRKPVDEYAAWCEEWLLECMARLRPGGLLYCYGWPETLAHVAVRFPVKKQRWLQWCYDNRVAPGSKMWQRSHESILAMWGAKPKLCVDQIREEYSEMSLALGEWYTPDSDLSRFGRRGKHYIPNPLGRLPKDYVKIPVLAGFQRTKDDITTGHPTQKPAALARWLLRAILPNDQSCDVLIPFAGSGSECRVAQSMGHNYLGIELDAQWVRLARESLAARKPML